MSKNSKKMICLDPVIEAKLREYCYNYKITASATIRKALNEFFVRVEIEAKEQTKAPAKYRKPMAF